MTAYRLSQIALKFNLHWSTIPPKMLLQSDPPYVDLSTGDIKQQIAAEWLEIAQRSQWKAYRKPSSLFQMVPLLTSLRLLPPKIEVLNAPLRTNIVMCVAT